MNAESISQKAESRTVELEDEEICHDSSREGAEEAGNQIGYGYNVNYGYYGYGFLRRLLRHRAASLGAADRQSRRQEVLPGVLSQLPGQQECPACFYEPELKKKYFE